MANVEDVAEGDIFAAPINGKSVVVTRIEGVLYALDNVCSHDMSPFDEATTEGFELCCPRHEGRFDVRSGKATCFPAVWPVGTWPVKEEDGRIWVGTTPLTKGSD